MGAVPLVNGSRTRLAARGSDWSTSSVHAVAPTAGREVRLADSVAAAQAGDTAAFAEIYREHANRVFALCRAALRDPDEAEDAMQETFLRALRALPRYRPEPGVSFLAWLLTIARNTTLTRVEQRSRTLALQPDDLVQHLPAAAPDQPQWVTDPAIAAALDGMPLSQRQVLVLRYALGVSPDECARVLGRTSQATRQLQTRALRTMRRRLSPASPASPSRLTPRSRH